MRPGEADRCLGLEPLPPAQPQTVTLPGNALAVPRARARPSSSRSLSLPSAPADQAAGQGTWGSEAPLGRCQQPPLAGHVGRQAGLLAGRGLRALPLSA